MTGITPSWAWITASSIAISSAAVGQVSDGLQPGKPASAAEPESSAAATAAGGTVADIVVTAQRRAQRLQDVPVAVSVVSGATLARSNLTTLESVTARLPDVKIVSGPLVDYLNIRGIGSGQNAGFEQSVGTFVDGLYRGRSKSTRAALFDVGQIEVLKGPQTTFFGNNTIAGALNITTRKPGDQLEYNVSGLYAFEDGEYSVEGGIGGPLSDTLALRVAGRASGLDGYLNNETTGHDAPRNRDLLGRFAVRWEPTSSFRVDARFDIGRIRSRDANSAIVLNCPSPFAGPTDFACGPIAGQNGGPTGSKPFYRSFAPPTFSNYDFKEAEVTGTLDLGGASLSSITGYFHHDFHQLVQLVPAALQVFPGYDLALSPANERFTQFSQEIRLQSATGGTLEYMVGGYYAHARSFVEANFGENFIPAFGPLVGISRDRFRDRTLSGFASATIRPIDHLRINLGARYTDVRKQGDRFDAFGTSANPRDFDDFVPFPVPLQSLLSGIFGTDLGNFAQTVRDDHKFLPSVGVQYDLARDVMAYATYTKGFKAGGYSAANTASVFGPEAVDAYEIGLKTVLLDRRLILNLDVFRSNYKNIQETTITFPGGIPVSSVANAAASRAQGVEANASLRISDNLTLTTDLAYLDSTYRAYPNGICTMEQSFAFVPSAAVPACVQDLSGKRRPYSSRWSGNVGANVSYPIGTYMLRFDPLLYFSSRFFTTAQADPLLEQPRYAKVDLRLGFGPSDQRWEIAVVGKNVTDKATASYRNPLTGGNGSAFAFPDRPRSIAVQFSVKG